MATNRSDAARVLRWTVRAILTVAIGGVALIVLGPILVIARVCEFAFGEDW